MRTLLHIVSSRAPYHRAGLTFALATGKTVAEFVKPIDDFSDVQLEQLLADPHLAVIAFREDADDASVLDERAALIERARLLEQREAAVAEAAANVAAAQVELERRANELMSREAIVSRTAVPVFATSTLTPAIDAAGVDTPGLVSDVLVAAGVDTAGLVSDVLVETDQERADRIERDGRDRINVDADEPVDRTAAPNTPRNPRRRPPSKIPSE